MKYLDLKNGSETLSVSKLAIGTASSMRGLSNAEIFNLLDIYLEAGGNCIDTARAYSEGRMEEIVGQWIKASKNRHKIVVSSKGCHLPPGSRQHGSLKVIRRGYGI